MKLSDLNYLSELYLKCVKQCLYFMRVILENTHFHPFLSFEIK